MLVTYKPEGQDPRSWTFEPGRTRLSEAAAVEKHYGSSWEQFAAEVQAGGARARRVLLWMLQRRDHPALRFEDVPDCYLDELVLEHTVAELLSFRTQLHQAGLPEAELIPAINVINAQLAEARKRPELGGELGKASSEIEH